MLYSKLERKRILKGLQKIVESVSLDDSDMDYWLSEGIPDEPSEEDYDYISEDIELYNDILKVFSIVLKEEKE